MKNRKIISLTVAMVAVVLVGVLGLSRFFETSWQQPEQVDNSLSTGIPDIEIASSISAHGNALPLDGSFSIADDNGVYSAQMLNDNYYNMIYSDFFSGDAEIMCIKTGCNHTNEECTACIEKPGVFFTSNSRLYLIKDKQTVYEISFKDYSRKAIAEFSVDYFYDEDMIFSNNEYFFTKVLCKADNKYRIVAVSFETGEITPLIEINRTRELVAASGEDIYLLETAESDEGQQNSDNCNIAKYNVSSGRIEIMYTFDNNDTDYYFYKDSMIYMNKSEMLLKKVWIDTAEEQIIKDFSETDFSGDFAFRGANENYVVVEFFPDSVIVVDAKNGTVKENTLQRYNLRADSQDKLIPSFVVDDKVVFCEGGKTITLTYDYVGKQQTTIPYYAFMSDTDYYNNIKNHTVMEY